MEAYLTLFAIAALLVCIACSLYILSWLFGLLSFAWRLFVAFAERANSVIGWLLYRKRLRRWHRDTKAVIDEESAP